MKHSMRIGCLVLAFLMAVSVLSACKGGGTETGTEGTTDTSAQASGTETGTDVGTEPETTPDKPDDSDRNTLALCGEGLSTCIVLPDLAALWEQSAAEALQQKLSGLTGTEPQLLKAADLNADGNGPFDAFLRIGPACTAADPAAVGTAGYSLRVVGEKTLELYAADENGMAEALAALAQAMTVKEGKACVAIDLSAVQKKDADVKETVKLSGEWGETIAYANGIANSLNSAFTSGKRAGYDIKNSTMELLYDLHGMGTKQVTGFYNTKGVPYLADSMDVFLRTDSGAVCYASNSRVAARVNVYRLGYYYRDVHILDQNFSSGDGSFDADNTLNLLTKKTHWTPYLVSTPVVDKETYGITFNVEDAYDPYLSFNTSVNTKKFNALRIVMRTEKAASASIYINNGSGFNSNQTVSFQVTPGEEFHEYVVMLNTMQDYTKGNISSIRLDVGSFDGEKIEIAEIWAVSVGSEEPQITLDRTYHAYADKLHEQLHLVAVGDVDNLAAYGMQAALIKDSVKGVYVIDATGAHKSLTEADWNTAFAVAFDVDRAGVIGWILPAGAEEKMSVSEKDGTYLFTIEHIEKESVTYHHGNQFSVGWRIYNDETHSFDGFAHEAEIERNPLEMRITEASDGAKVVGYNPLRGCYEYKVNGEGFSQAYRNPQKQFAVNGEFTNGASERKLYIMTGETEGCLENAVILDGDGTLLPISPEVCKNFKGENEEPLYDAGDTAYGESIIPLVLKANETRDFTVLHLYQNWGAFPLKQLSSIQFIAPYYHLSCGVTETNCIAPYFVYGKDYWTLPDFRAMSAPLWSTQPQHTSVGRLYWLQYTDAEGKWYGSDFVDDTIGSSGPVYADILSTYLSDDGRISVTYRHLETPQQDENRTYYEIDLTVLEDVAIKDFRNDFSFFSFDGRGMTFAHMGYVDEDGNEVGEDTDLTPHSRIIKLGDEAPYFDYWKGSANDFVNFALLIKNARITLNGKSVAPHFVIRETFAEGNNRCYLSLDLGETVLKAGDNIHINMILMPWGSQYSKDDSNVSAVRLDTCLWPQTVEVGKGTLIPDAYMPRIMADHDVAEFTVTDGGGRMAARVYGLTGWGAPVLEELVDGKWVPYVTNHYDYDGYMVYYENDGTFSVSFIFETATNTSRTFRVTGN